MGPWATLATVAEPPRYQAAFPDKSEKPRGSFRAAINKIVGRA